MTPAALANLQTCSSLIAEASSRFPRVREALECRDAEIFAVVIPSLVVLRAVSRGLGYQIASINIV
jgi:hypothetical protein